MWRRMLLAAVALIVAAATIVVGSSYTIERERRTLVDGYTTELWQRLKAAAIDVESALGDIESDLDLVARLLDQSQSGGEQRRILTALVGAQSAYRAAGIWRNGALVVAHPAQADDVPTSVRTQMKNIASEAAGATPGEIMIRRAAAPDPGSWFLLFAQPIASDVPDVPTGAVVLFVHSRPFFEKLRLVAADATTELLILDPDGHPTPISSEGLVNAIARTATSSAPALAQAIKRIRDEESGSLTLPAREAVTLGFPASVVAVAFESIRLRSDMRWGVASFSSLTRFRSHERTLMRRVLITATALSSVFLFFAVYVLVAARRSALLTERLRHAQELAHVKDALGAQLLRAEKLSTVGVLAAGIAHEVGTPLGVIRGRAEYALEKLGEEHAQSAGLRVILEQIDRVSRIIHGLLDFSREKQAKAGSVDVVRVAATVRELLRYEAERRRVTLKNEVDGALYPVAADGDQLQQVLINLVMNALDASSAGDTVTIRAAAVSDALLSIEVIDEGAGIPPENVHKVFDPFFTTKKRGAGTGLGLTIVQQIVRSHGADIELLGNDGRGTRVKLTWPVVKSREESAIHG